MKVKFGTFIYFKSYGWGDLMLRLMPIIWLL